MPLAEDKLKTNILGKLFGVDFVQLNNNSLEIIKNESVISSFALSECKKFIGYKRTVFGGKLTIQIGSETHEVKFTKDLGAIAFTKSLNKIIARSIADYIQEASKTFTKEVFVEYPRDSRVARLTELCRTLHDGISEQKEKWTTYLTPDELTKTKDVARFHPVNVISLQEHHEQLKLKERKRFFDEVESNPLTLEQRLGVLRSNDRNMVIAAAGTGKTSVIVAKVLDLIDRGLASSSEILVMAYNRASATELLERVTEKAVSNNIRLPSLPEISTFHALGRKLIRDSGTSTYLSAFAEDEFKFKQWITEWIESYLREDNSRIFEFIELAVQPINPFDFKTKADYENYVRDNEFRTLNGELVKGYQELLIANFLYMNQIPYGYETPYITKRRIDVGFDYRPDFHIEGTNIYIEHFGTDRQGNTRPDIDAIKYAESKASKISLHQAYGTTLIQTFHYEWCEDILLSSLKEKLASHNISCSPMSVEQIFEKLNSEHHIANWAELMKKALQAIRVERLTQLDIKHRLEKQNILHPESTSILFDSLLQAYVEELRKQDRIDFDDMIIKATELIYSRSFSPKWKYILVDEFQDISAVRMDFISALVSEGPDSCLTVVGDDWQSIYRFAGGKLELTTRFESLVGTYSETKLQKTFRYNNSIASTAGQFIMENPEQYTKYIDTHKIVDTSQVYLLDDKVGSNDGLYKRVREVIEKISENDSQGTIAIIARYNYLLEDSKQYLKPTIITNKVKFWSYHRSKGLEADYCILIGFFQGKSGFPNENRNQAVIEALLPTLDSFPHSEERRLLYVGITRAKNKCYIIADPTSPSDFITELLSPKYELNIVSQAFKERYREIFKCPNCEDGYLRLVNGKYGEFYSCSTKKGCLVGKARVCSKCKAPSIDTRNESKCNNEACQNSIKLCNKCGRPMKIRDGKFGKFWGCTGYGIKDDQCKNTMRV